MFHPIKAPRHYAGDGKVDCKRAMESMLACADDAKLSPASVYWWCCAFKYLWRWPLKNGVQDIEKCRQCLEYLLEDRKGNHDR